MHALGSKCGTTMPALGSNINSHGGIPRSLCDRRQRAEISAKLHPPERTPVLAVDDQQLGTLEQRKGAIIELQDYFEDFLFKA